MKIALLSDAWSPQINGVVRTLSALCAGLQAAGHTVIPLTPDLFRTLPCPTYPEIRLAVGAKREVWRRLDALRPDAFHIATEGPLGLAGRSYCLKRGLPFTTAFHTKYPDYLKARFRLPLSIGYAALRRFHAGSSAVMVATDSVRAEMSRRGFAHVVEWTRGVDTAMFRPGLVPALDLPRPVFLCVGRIAIEKNLPGFLDLDLPGTKLVVGDGPMLPELRRRYPCVHFAGVQEGEALARHYASADVFVMPSRTETFGLVLLEALACGVPVAALPVSGPVDVIGDSGVGVLDWDLQRAAIRALGIRPEACRAHALRFGWDRSVSQFLHHLRPVRGGEGHPVTKPSPQMT